MNSFFAEIYRLFLGNGIDALHIFEIMFRTCFMYLYTIANVRLMDKRSMGMLSPFEIIIIVALGTAVGDPMFYREVPLIFGMIVISTIVLTERVITKLSMSSVIFERLLNGRPILLIKDGVLLQKQMAKQGFSRDELYSILRQRGVIRISDVQMAYLEPSGSISLIKKESPSEADLVPDLGGYGRR